MNQVTHYCLINFDFTGFIFYILNKLKTLLVEFGVANIVYCLNLAQNQLLFCLLN